MSEGLTLEKLQKVRALLDVTPANKLVRMHLRPGKIWWEYSDRCEMGEGISQEQARGILELFSKRFH